VEIGCAVAHPSRRALRALLRVEALLLLLRGEKGF
jgi:hypothetical protein